MSGINQSGERTRIVPFRRVVIGCLLVAALLFLFSAALQVMASLQRWVVFGGSLGPDDLSVEDHVYDYYFASGDWVPIGTAAEQFGAGILVQVLGILAMMAGLMLIPAASRQSSKTAKSLVAAIEVALGFLVVTTFVLLGANALVSGLRGAASALSESELVFWLVFLIGMVGLCVLSRLWGNRLGAARAACLFLLGSTIMGYLVATYMIAPVFAGMSHDTAKWTETVIAVSTAAAAVAMFFGARDIARNTVATA